MNLSNCSMTDLLVKLKSATDYHDRLMDGADDNSKACKNYNLPKIDNKKMEVKHAADCA